VWLPESTAYLVENRYIALADSAANLLIRARPLGKSSIQSMQNRTIAVGHPRAEFPIKDFV
jgi:hypothetical protein